jgi:PAS domain S-box-containing protein
MYLSLPDSSDFQFLEGRVSALVPERARVFFRLDGRSVTLIGARFAARLRNGDSVRVLVQEAPDDDHVLYVLALQREEDGRIHYTGRRVGIHLIAISAALLATGLHAGASYLVVLGISFAMLSLIFGLSAVRVLRQFRAHLRGLSARGRVDASSSDADHLNGSQIDVPLTLAAGVLARRASNWPSEILEFTHDAIIIWEMDGAGIVYWNRAAERLYGYTREQAYGKVTHELLKTQLAGGVDELEEKLARHGVWIGALCHTRSDGRLVEVEARLSLMSQEHRPWLVLEVNRDVTDRNRAETARLEMEKQLRRMRSQAHPHD